MYYMYFAFIFVFVKIHNVLIKERKRISINEVRHIYTHVIKAVIMLWREHLESRA